MNHIVMHCPDEGIDKFEEISYLLKNKKKIDINDFMNVAHKGTGKPSAEVKEITEKFIEKAKIFFEVSLSARSSNLIIFLNLETRRSQRRWRGTSGRAGPNWLRP